MGVGCQHHSPATLTREGNPLLFQKGFGRPQSGSELVWKISPKP